MAGLTFQRSKIETLNRLHLPVRLPTIKMTSPVACWAYSTVLLITDQDIIPIHEMRLSERTTIGTVDMRINHLKALHGHHTLLSTVLRHISLITPTPMVLAIRMTKLKYPMPHEVLAEFTSILETMGDKETREWCTMTLARAPSHNGWMILVINNFEEDPSTTIRKFGFEAQIPMQTTRHMMESDM